MNIPWFITLRDLSIRQLKLQFVGSTMGLYWAILIPIFIGFGISYLFQNIFYVDELESKRLLVCFLCWIWFSQAIGQGVRLFVDQRVEFKQLGKKRILFVLSFCFSKYILFFPGFIIIAAYSVIVTPVSLCSILSIWISTLTLLILSVGLIFLIASWAVFYRDIYNIIDVILLVVLWASPVFFTSKRLPSELFWLNYVNPMSWFFETINFQFYPESVYFYYTQVLMFFVFSLLILFFGFSYFRKHEQEMIHYL